MDFPQKSPSFERFTKARASHTRLIIDCCKCKLIFLKSDGEFSQFSKNIQKVQNQPISNMAL